MRVEFMGSHTGLCDCVNYQEAVRLNEAMAMAKKPEPIHSNFAFSHTLYAFPDQSRVLALF